MKNYLVILIVLFCAVSSVNAQVIFEADFESGNLNSVTTTDSITYTITTKTDIGGRWFYFRIRNVKNRFIKVKISNSDVKRAVYSYDNKEYLRFTEAESPQTNLFQKTYERDTVYTAYYIPYTFSYLQTKLNSWKDSPYSNLDTLGFTLRNLPLQELKITDPSVPDSEKYNVWIHARTHPGETPTSFQYEGAIEKLLSDDEVISEYRKKIVFHTVPFTNPDGVYYGRSRTNYDGVDVESNWNKDETGTTQEVKLLKQRMTQVNNSKVMSVFQNIHSQASPSCTFWIHTASSTSDYFYRRQLQFCNLNTSNNSYFPPSDYSFSNLSMTFPEGWLWSNHGDKVLALTYETPYDYYSNGNLVTIDNLKWLGEKLVYSIAEFLEISHPKYLILDNKDLVTNWQKDSSGVQFFGRDYLSTYYANNFGNAVFETPQIQNGNYEVFGWWQNITGNAPNTKITITTGNETITKYVDQRVNGAKWNSLGNINLNNSGKITVTVSDSATGRIIADAFKIVYKGVPTSVERDIDEKDFSLYQNYPNPFNATTTIKFSLNDRSKVQLRVFNSLGELIHTLIDSEMSAGEHRVEFNTNALNHIASGVYYLQFVTPKHSETKGMILLK